MTDSPYRLDGRVALVTGSTTGLGKGIAFALGDAGAKVVLNFKNNEDRAAKTMEEYAEGGREGVLLRGDVTDPQEVVELVKEAEQAAGPIDLLVVNATPDQPLKPIEEYDWDFYQSMIDFFIKSPYLLTRALLPSMKERGFGRIVNIGSEVFRRGVGNFSAYVAAKGGQTGWTRSMATELAPYGITGNMVSPGWIPVARHEKDPEEMKEAYRELIPAGRWGVPEDVGGAVTYLCSNEASFITGQDLAVNGGMTLG